MTQNIENQRIIEAAINKIADYEAVKDNQGAVTMTTSKLKNSRSLIVAFRRTGVSLPGQTVGLWLVYWGVR